MTAIPTLTEVLAATRLHGSTARGWRALARDLARAGRGADANACEAVASDLDLSGDLWGSPSTADTGPCPWCAVMMDIGDEDPLTERCCDACAEVPLARLEQRSPVMAARYRAARARSVK